MARLLQEFALPSSARTFRSTPILQTFLYSESALAGKEVKDSVSTIKVADNRATILAALSATIDTVNELNGADFTTTLQFLASCETGGILPLTCISNAPGIAYAVAQSQVRAPGDSLPR